MPRRPLPAFTRLITGILMLVASVDWFLDASTLLIEPALAQTNSQALEEKTA